MQIRRIRLSILAAAMFVGGVGTAMAADVLDTARQAFAEAYDTQNYPKFCAVLDKDAAFRGALVNYWTFTADQIIKRFKAPCTCTEYANNPKCGAGRINVMKVTPFTIGSTTIELKPAAPAIETNSRSPGDPRYAMDAGAFDMLRKTNTTGVTTTGHYVILWIKDGNDWKIKHMDMTKAGN
jgi:hypothetical protein